MGDEHRARARKQPGKARVTTSCWEFCRAQPPYILPKIAEAEAPTAASGELGSKSRCLEVAREEGRRVEFDLAWGLTGTGDAVARKPTRFEMAVGRARREDGAAGQRRRTRKYREEERWPGGRCVGHETGDRRVGGLQNGGGGLWTLANGGRCALLADCQLGAGAGAGAGQGRHCTGHQRWQLAGWQAGRPNQVQRTMERYLGGADEPLLLQSTVLVVPLALGRSSAMRPRDMGMRDKGAERRQDFGCVRCVLGLAGPAGSSRLHLHT